MKSIQEKILELKKEKNAIILAHLYQPSDIQEIADFVGDSLELSRLAKDSTADVIIFCGVFFMAGSAKLLSPQKTVILPNRQAGCPMADMLEPEDIIKLREKHPNAAVVTYVNSSVEAKAYSDICCTSSNAIKVVNSLPNKDIIFVPDKNLGSYVARFTDKNIILFDGYCHVHNRITTDHINKARLEHPNVKILVHPECPAPVVDLADFVGSTAQIINYVTASDKKEFVIGTEKGILHQLKLKNPDKVFYMLADNFLCTNMKKTSLEHVLESLETGEYEIEISDDIIKKASQSLHKMLDIK
jgi:quinolinate synthase